MVTAGTAFSSRSPASALTAFIYHAAQLRARRQPHPEADCRLAMLSYSDSLRIYTNGDGRRETIGQHCICWARTACVSALLCGSTAARHVHPAPPCCS